MSKRSPHRGQLRRARTLSMLSAALVLPAVLGAVQPAAAQSQDFPAKPIRLIEGFGAGGVVDLVARLLMPKLSAALGQPIILENRVGAAGVIASSAVSKAPPDGHTWLITTGSHTSNTAFNAANVPYDPIKDFTPVTQIARTYGMVHLVHPSIPARNVKEFVAIARKHPGKLTYGAAGIGNILFIGAEMLKAVTGTDIRYVQYKGAAQATNDLMGGHIDTLFLTTPVAMPLIKGGKARPLAITGPIRWKGLPDVPTMRESGFPDFDLIGWFGLWLPPNTRPEIVARLHAEVERAVAEPDIRARFEELGLLPGGMRTDEFARYIAQDLAQMRELAARIAKAGGLKQE
ncbi:MAG: tripartite tricarboxylate transporter substrate binding protein [Burkholderiales bacterium]|nr:tripartite tricarboxylate transporter substrate binding protein [Burkholderiales bacterium]